MRGSSLEVVVQVPVMETQSCEEVFWKVSCRVGLAARSENLLEEWLERKRKSGPTRWGRKKSALAMSMTLSLSRSGVGR